MVKIVTSFPMQRVALGQSIVNSIRLALAEADYRAGDYTIELVVLDDGNAEGQWLADKEAENARRAVNDPQVVAYIGPLNSGAAKISIPITNRGGLAHISPSNTWPGLTKVGFAPGEPGIFYPTGQRNYFRTAPTDDLQAPAAVKWAENLGFKTVFLLDDGETYGKGLADLFEAFAYTSRLTVIGHQTIDKTAADFRDVLTAIQQQAPNLDLIYFGGYSANGAPLLVRQMKELNMAAHFMGPDGIVDSYFIQQAGPAAEGGYATLVGVPPAALTTERGQAFVQAYRAAYNTEPEAFSYLGYDAAQVIVQALRRADPLQRSTVLETINSLGTIEGAAGHFQFDEQGDTTLKVISGNIVRNQTFQFMEILPTR
ncbi:MAG: branched-chain amino acid ABC transporter substrate-binding protein [Caldilineae bacterium]|nr:MAG: branched-chain amino acid ABC transporter substrate-binding protein [Caldilineae bacterium]